MEWISYNVYVLAVVMGKLCRVIRNVNYDESLSWCAQPANCVAGCCGISGWGCKDRTKIYEALLLILFLMHV